MRALLIAAAAAAFFGPASAAITLLGTGAIPGTATDQSGLAGLLEDGVTPHNRIGGLGSAIAYDGAGSTYYATPDRGPADGLTSYIDRLYTLDIALTPKGPYGPDSYTVTPTVTATALLHTPQGDNFVGSIGAFDGSGSANSLRFDPEGLRPNRCRNSVYISDEYGPYLYRFNLKTGERKAVVALPNKFKIDAPSSIPAEELSNNAFGRQANRGMEGLAISPDGSKLYGILQSPLIQDGGLSPSNSRVGTNARIVEVDLAGGGFREFLYPMENAGNGMNEIVAINDHEFLVIERDGRAGAAAKFKRLYKIDINGASDLRNTKALPVTGVPEGVTPVAKSLFLDLLDPAYGLAASIPEKIEGLAFGPKLPGGRRALIVSSDNDFFPTQPSLFYVFGVDAADLPGFQPQQRGTCN